MKEKNEVNEEITTGIIEPELKVDKKPELTEEESELKALIKHYSKYTGVFTPNDMANVSGPVLKADQLNLLFGIFSEVKKNNELTSKLIALLENR